MAEESYKVSLHVYDLSQGLARQLSTTFLGKSIEGIWHTGIVVYGNEYYFGGGIQNAAVGTTPYGTPLKVVDLGVTHVPKDVFEMYLQEIDHRYTAETYRLLTHNCNNFSNEVAQFLVGASIPDYILNLPNEVISSPMGALMLPMIQQLETTLRAGAVPQAPQFSPAAVSNSIKTASSVNKSASGSNVNLQKRMNQLKNRKQKIYRRTMHLSRQQRILPRSLVLLSRSHLMVQFGTKFKRRSPMSLLQSWLPGQSKRVRLLLLPLGE